MGRGGVVSKGHKGACYWVWYLCKKIVECLEKDPSCFRKWPEPCFLRPDLKFFLEFSKKKFFATCVSLNMTRQNYFFVKKVCKKSLPIKFVVDFFQKKGHRGECNWVWNLCNKIFSGVKKDPCCFRKHPEQCFLRPFIIFFEIFEKKIIRPKHCPQNDPSKLFSCKKTLSKNFDDKIGKKSCQKIFFKSTFFHQKN